MKKEELASEEEAETAGGGRGEARRPLTATAGELEESGAEDALGGAVAGRGATADAASEDVAAAGAGGHHGAGIRENGEGHRPGGILGR